MSNEQKGNKIISANQDQQQPNKAEEKSFFTESRLYKISHWSGILSWVILVLYFLDAIFSLSPAVHTTWVTSLFGKNFLDILSAIFDWLDFLTPQLEKIATGLAFFLILQTAKESIFLLLANRGSSFLR
jgi:hypothetical protein